MIGSSGVSDLTTLHLGSLYTLVMLNFIIFAEWTSSSAAVWTGWWKAEWLKVSISIYFMISLADECKNSASFGISQNVCCYRFQKRVFCDNFFLLFIVSCSATRQLSWTVLIRWGHNEFCLSTISKKKCLHNLRRIFAPFFVIEHIVKHDYKSK